LVAVDRDADFEKAAVIETDTEVSFGDRHDDGRGCGWRRTVGGYDVEKGGHTATVVKK
jgi:hypothetical protein